MLPRCLARTVTCYTREYRGASPRWTFLDVLASRARTSERTFSLTLGMNKVQLLHLLTLRSSIGTQPQRDVCGLHRLPNHPHQVIAQSVEVCLVTKLRGEGF